MLSNYNPIGRILTLLSEYDTRDPESRLIASIGLRRHASEFPANLALVMAVPQFAEALTDPQDRVSVNAAWTLGHVVSHKWPTFPAFFDLFHQIQVTNRPTERQNCAAYLESRGHGSVRDLPRHLRTLRNGRSADRLEALAAIGLIGPSAKGAVDELRPFLNPRKPLLRATTMVAIERLLDAD